MFFSLEFWVFVAVVLFLHNLMRGRAQNGILLLASYALYAYLDPRFLALLIAATTLTYVLARRLSPDSPHRRRTLIIGIVSNLGVLGFFKYANFFVGTINPFLVRASIAPSPMVLNILLPLGISF